jgi:hypothetical protein
MRHRFSTLMISLLTAACYDVSTATQSSEANGGFEVWIVDQSGTQPGTPSGYGGTLHIFEGSSLMGASASSATPIASIDLAPLNTGVYGATGKSPCAHDPVQ